MIGRNMNFPKVTKSIATHEPKFNVEVQTSSLPRTTGVGMPRRQFHHNYTRKTQL
jgi:hypothetical protein